MEGAVPVVVCMVPVLVEEVPDVVAVLVTVEEVVGLKIFGLVLAQRQILLIFLGPIPGNGVLWRREL